MMKFAYVTCLNSVKYVLAAAILRESLERSQAAYPFYVVIPSNSDDKLIEALSNYNLKYVYDNQFYKPPFSYEEYEKNRLLNCYYSFIKLSVLNLKQFDKIVLLDTDTYVFKNIDHLFDYNNLTSVISGKCSHKNWVDLCAGLIVIEPKKFTTNKVNNAIQEAIKFRERENGIPYIGDQDVWTCYDNYLFRRDEKLALSENYQILDHEVDFVLKELKLSKRDIYLVHFASSPKIWLRNNLTLLKNKISKIIKLKLNEFYIINTYLNTKKKVCKKYGKKTRNINNNTFI